MLTLATGETLRGVAGSASAISYTVTGDLKTTSDSFQVIAQGQIPSSVGTLYTVPASTSALIQKIFLRNVTASPVSVALYVNGTGASNQIVGIQIPATGNAILAADGWKVYDSAGVLQFVGSTGPQGLQGEKGWSPVLAAVADGARYVFQIVDWVGGAGTKPSTVNQFIGAAGIVGTAAAAVDIRGPAGAPGTSPSAFTTITGNSGTATADTASDSLSVVGSGAINVAASDNPEVLTITVPVDSVTNAMIAPMPTMTLKGNVTGGSAGPTDLTATQATALLNTATTALKGLMDSVEKIKLSDLWFDCTTDFGANNLDKTGATDNTSKINAQITALPNGAVWFWPPGTYDTNGGHSINKTLIVMGAGRSISVINCTHATNTVFTLASGAAGTGFEQIRISADTPSLRTAGYAIDYTNIANSYVQQSDILYQWSAVRSAGALQFIDDCNIRECGANAINGQCVLIDSTGDRYIRRLTTDNPSDPTGFAGLRVRQCSSLVITDSNIINATNCLDIVPNGGGGTAVASILSVNTFYDSSVIGVNIVPATNNDTAQRIRFINCWFSTMSTAGVRIGNAAINVANINSVDFVGCDFYQNPIGIDSLGAAEWSVRASRLAGNSGNAIQVVQGLQAGVQNFSVTDCFIGNGAGFGANGQGISIAAGTYGRYQILDNRGLESNTTPGISDLGSVGPTGQKNVANNMGCLLKGALPLNNSAAAAIIAGRGAATSGTGETYLFGTRIPANGLSAGQTFRVSMMGQSSSTGTLIFRLRVGAASTTADAILWTMSTSAAQVANQYAKVDALVTVVSIGNPGSVAGAARAIVHLTVLGETVAAEVLAAPNTTAPWFISMTGTCSVGTFTVRQAAIEAL